MLNQLLCSLRQFAQTRENEVNKGYYHPEFAASLIQSYAESMGKALTLIGKESYIITIQSEADSLCVSVYPKYKPQLRLIYSNNSQVRPARSTGHVSKISHSSPGAAAL
jgi:hypothetical protein